MNARGLATQDDGLGAVDGLNLAAGPGEVVGLVGLDGAGRTTLLRPLMGTATAA